MIKSATFKNVAVSKYKYNNRAYQYVSISLNSIFYYNFARNIIICSIILKDLLKNSIYKIINPDLQLAKNFRHSCKW